MHFIFAFYTIPPPLMSCDSFSDCTSQTREANKIMNQFQWVRVGSNSKNAIMCSGCKCIQYNNNSVKRQACDTHFTPTVSVKLPFYLLWHFTSGCQKLIHPTKALPLIYAMKKFIFQAIAQKGYRLMYRTGDSWWHSSKGQAPRGSMMKKIHRVTVQQIHWVL